jgi:hypothetical protein
MPEFEPELGITRRHATPFSRPSYIPDSAKDEFILIRCVRTQPRGGFDSGPDTAREGMAELS